MRNEVAVKEMRKDFKDALAKLQELYILYWQTDVLSQCDKETMAILLSKPYVRRMLRNQTYHTNDPKGVEEALSSLENMAG